MLMIGCDFHTRFQQIAMVDITTGEMITRRLEHENGQARNFYAALPGPARVGIEATMATQWFQRMLSELGHELWVGDAAAIRATMVRKQKTDARDALHILDLLITDRFPRIWIPSRAERDVRMLKHRHKLVRFRASIMNQLHALAMGKASAGKRSCGRRLAARNWKAWPSIHGPAAGGGSCSSCSTNSILGSRSWTGRSSRKRKAARKPST